MLMVTTIFAAGVFTGILTRSGMLDGAVDRSCCACFLRQHSATLPIGMAVTSMPLSLAFDPDSFYFGLLPVLANASHAAGGSSIEVARAAVLGQMTTGFPVSPLTPSTFLLVGLAGVDLADHQRRTIGYAFVVTIVMTVGGGHFPSDWYMKRIHLESRLPSRPFTHLLTAARRTVEIESCPRDLRPVICLPVPMQAERERCLLVRTST